ncbi:MAG: tRNA (adenosine(37)-N6)-threonylcarbamoyltransferase complex dimerization subunit type 1 TsaB [Calditrichaeota bacterium]|nr:tRNA (adenosine(37)-N6)-threonylcarbamoyltransferase complex dimerization subunit type 1 TsaB [Calditrichota bacterium]
MKILGIDTSSETLALALTEDDNLISEARFWVKRAHAERLVAAVGNLLTQSRLSFDELEGIALSIGPGSFTGLRIGLAAVKGMVFEKKIAVAAVPTLEVLAYGGRFWQGAIRPLIRAQTDEAYTAVFNFENDLLVADSPAQLISLADLDSVVAEKTLLIASGFKNFQEFVTPKLNELTRIASAQDSLISGFSVARLGWQRFKKNQVEAIESLEPFYLKEFKAKRKIGF